MELKIIGAGFGRTGTSSLGGDFEDREYAIELFQRHNAEVQRHVPADRLLVYEVKQDWQPLCDFLGVEAPRDKPFPHLNDTAEFRRMIRIIAIAAHTVPLAVASLFVAALVALRRQRQAVASLPGSPPQS